MFIETKCIDFISDTIIKEYMILSDVAVHSNNDIVIQMFRRADDPMLQDWQQIPVHSYLDTMHYSLCMKALVKAGFIELEEQNRKKGKIK